MRELWLKFSDPDGVTRRVAVERDEFVIGRHSECDLAIADSRLSRRHAKIARSGSGFTIEDLGSSNGTDLNGTPVFDATEIRSGDVLNFGGVEVAAEIKAKEEKPAEAPAAAAAPAAVPSPAAPVKKTQKEERGSSGIPLWLIIAAPVTAAVLVVVIAGVVLLVVAKSGGPPVANASDDEDPIALNDDADGPSNRKKDDNPPANSDITGPTNTAPVNNGGTTATDPDGPAGPTPTPANLSETAKVEVNGAGFLRRIAQNDPRAFLTTEQAKRVGAKVKQFSGSSAVAENINNARRNAAAIKTLAAAKNMKPQMLAVAAIAKLGNTRGDVMATAQSMADVLDKLSIQLGNELADDCLLSIAAFDQGAAGDTMKMRNMLQDLANRSSESSRTIRTIWFLQKEGKITQAEFDRALVFLAIGTIAQNPKEFGVNAEPLNL